jgi:hypothetical protein
MIKFGLDPFIDSLYDVQQMNDRIDSHAYRGIQTVTQLYDAYNNIQQFQSEDLQLFDHNITDLELNAVCVKNVSMFSSVVGNLTIPTKIKTGSGYTNTTIRFKDVIDWTLHQEEIQSTIANFSTFDFNGSNSVLYQLTNGTAAVDIGIDTLNDHDWLIRLLVVIMDVVVIFLIVGILFVKDNVDFPAYQSFTSYVLLPLFCASLFATVIATYYFTTVGVLNAGMFFQNCETKLRLRIVILTHFFDIIRYGRFLFWWYRVRTQFSLRKYSRSYFAVWILNNKSTIPSIAVL